MVKISTETRPLLNAVRRLASGTSSANQLRAQGLIPGVVYGKKTDPIVVAVNGLELGRVLHREAGEHALLTLRVADGDGKPSGKPWERPVLVKAVQHHPVDGHIMHIDFHAILLTEKIRVNVTVELRGEPVGVKEQDGILEHFLREVEVECLPTEIPKHLEFDVSAMSISDTVHVRDLQPPPGVVILTEADGVVASVQSPKEEKPEEETVVSEPEVLSEKKEEDAEGEAAQGEAAQGKTEGKKDADKKDKGNKD